MPEELVYEAQESGIERGAEVWPFHERLTGCNGLRPLVVVELVHARVREAWIALPLQDVDKAQDEGQQYDDAADGGVLESWRAGV